MRKIFIDAGAHEGCSVKKFRKEHDKKNEYLIYSFEPEPRFVKCFKDIPNHVFINKAVWTRDGKKEFYRSTQWLHAGSSLLKRKRSGALDKKHPIVVKTIDFSKWVSDNLYKNDYIILKLDVEGAEYEVIPKMMKDNTFEYIDELWIEWHMRKLGMTLKQHNAVANKVKIPTIKWDALKYCNLRKKK